MPDEKTKADEKDDPEQSKRFIETARKLESDESGERFHSAIDVIKCGEEESEDV